MDSDDDLSSLEDNQLEVDFEKNNPEFVSMTLTALDATEKAVKAHTAFPQPRDEAHPPREPLPGAPKRYPRKAIKKHSGVVNLQDAFDKTDRMFGEVIITVMCYRAELGTTLQKVRSTYMRLFQQLQDKMDRVMVKKEVECEKAVEDCKSLLNEYVRQKLALKEQLDKAQERIQQAEARSRTYAVLLEAEQKDSIQLREILKLDAGNMNAMLEDLESGKEGEPAEGTVHEVGQTTADAVKGIAHDTQLQQSLEKLQEVMAEMEAEQNTKHLLLREMKDVVVNMVQTNVREEKSTQVGDGELYWNLAPAGMDYPKGSQSSNPQSLYATMKEFLGLEGVQVRAKGEEKWNMTPALMHFLANTPIQAGRPWPYKHFKNVHLDICLSRFNFTSEITGCLQSNVPMDQYLCVYFMQKHQLRRLAELKLMEFLTSLKYYASKWDRASLFCKVTGITGNLYDNEEFIYADYNTQLYYLYAFQQLYADPTSIWESPEGQTWMKNDKAKEITMDLLPWLKRGDPKKIKQRITPLENKLTDPSGTTDFFIDLDKLLGIYLTEFVEQRNKTRVKIGKEFIKRNQIQQGLFTHSEFSQTVRKNWAGSEDEKMVFPGDFSMSRAFYVAHCMNGNTFEISQISLLTAVVIYGLDSPFPFAIGNLDYLVPLLGDKVDAEATRLRKEKAGKEASDRPAGEKGTYLKASLRKAAKPSPEPGTMNQQGPSLERVASLLSQHYAILREVKGYADQIREQVTEAGSDTTKIMSAFERLSIILSNACEFFNFPVVF